ncbi:HAMP domain-containing histidine kinase [Burkholderia pseudomultivorans]|uniref:sensor histidine kinase n=1 Tax=Burkholderia pseudomultivorans TaxID=1207504 RepID=UPI00287518BC|nr:HAMP domain-containing sensor histidine kinase [Burkholderia pseudomultivorans]MDS0859812.1 HAMP domain-containing histidine kinase [Burkholderia pseudomultivorans]
MFSRVANPYGKTISFRLALWYSTYFIISTALLFALAYVLLASTLRAHDRNNIEQRLHQLAAQYQATNLAGVKKELALEAKLRHGKPFFIRIAGPHNATVFTEIPDQWAEFEVGRMERAPPTKAGALIRLPAKDDEAVLEIASMRLANGGLLQVGKSTEERDSVLESFGWIVAGVMLPMVLIGVVGGAFLARQSLRPIRQLVHTVRAIKSGAMDARVAVRPANDELNELGTLFNGMLDRIEALVQGMRDALDNVAHDLRTPVARIRGAAEIALRSDGRPERYREALVDCVEESDQLLQMLNTMMDISEAETGTLKLQREVVDVPALLVDTIDLYRYVAENKGIALSLAKPTPIWLTADRNRLRQVIANLLDNAIKYTPAGGRVEVSAVSEPHQVVIRVSDTGVGMTPDELSKIWERLYRGDRSRSERGLGLGLSLVKAIVEAHCGRVHAASTPGAGSTFTLVFPAEPFADSASPADWPPIITNQ